MLQTKEVQNFNYSFDKSDIHYIHADLLQFKWKTTNISNTSI